MSTVAPKRDKKISDMKTSFLAELDIDPITFSVILGRFRSFSVIFDRFRSFSVIFN